MGGTFLCASMYIHTHTHVYMFLYIYTYIYRMGGTFLYASMYTNTHTHVYIFLYIYTYMYIYLYLYIYIYICIYVHVYVYVYKYKHTHALIDTLTDTQAHRHIAMLKSSPAQHLLNTVTFFSETGAGKVITVQDVRHAALRTKSPCIYHALISHHRPRCAPCCPTNPESMRNVHITHSYHITVTTHEMLFSRRRPTAGVTV